MIRVIFYVLNDDKDLEKEIDISCEADEWLEKNIEGLSFDCHDFLYQLEEYPVFYFTSNNDEKSYEDIFSLLNKKILPEMHLGVRVSIIDDIVDKNEKKYFIINRNIIEQLEFVPVKRSF